MWIRVKEWPTVTPSAGSHSSGRKNCSFILNSYILHSSCGCKKISHRDFWKTLLRNMLAHTGPEWRVPRPLGRPPNVESHVAMLKVCDSKQWPTRPVTKLRCRVCKARGMTKKFSWSAVWRGTVCETNMFWKLPHQGTNWVTITLQDLRFSKKCCWRCYTA
jgi:hypothetical protein